MITHAQARSMAEAAWGTGGTTSRRTNRRGAFYFSCSGHGGFIVDASCLSDQEKSALEEYEAQQFTTGYFDPETQKLRRLVNPFRAARRSFTISRSWERKNIGIFAFEEDCAWCLPVIFAGIRTAGMTDEDALTSFSQWYAKSNHASLKAQACIQSRARSA